LAVTPKYAGVERMNEPMNAEEIVRALRYEQETHKRDIVSTCGTNISAMCKDSADCIESLPTEIDRMTARADKAEAELAEAVEVLCRICQVTRKAALDAGWQSTCNGRSCFNCGWRGRREK